MNKILKFINIFLIPAFLVSSCPKLVAAGSDLNDKKSALMANSQELLESKLFEAVANVNPELVSALLVKMLKANMLSPIVEKSILLEAKNNVVKYSNKSINLKILNSVMLNMLGASSLFIGCAGIAGSFNPRFSSNDRRAMIFFGVLGAILSSWLLPNGIGLAKSIQKNKMNSANALKVFNLIKTRLKQNKVRTKDQANKSVNSDAKPKVA